MLKIEPNETLIIISTSELSHIEAEAYKRGQVDMREIYLDGAGVKQ